MTFAKVCKGCGEVKSEEEFYKYSKQRGHMLKCKKCCVKDTTKWYKAHPGYARKRHLEKTYGIDAGDYDRIFECQGNVCKICHNGNDSQKRKFNIDHDHKTGNIRGILCSRCNVMIGMAVDDPDILEKGIAYLKDACSEILQTLGEI